LEDNKIYFLLEFLESVLLGQTIIFCNTIRKAIWIYEKLKEYNFFPFLIHSQIPQTERIMIDDKFKKNKIKIIIATDVYSRGIYVQRVIKLLIGIDNYKLRLTPNQRNLCT
jgi:ATP-dependent RNA helicase